MQPDQACSRLKLNVQTDLLYFCFTDYYKSNHMKKLLLSGFLLCSLIGFANEEIRTPIIPIDGVEISDEWKEYATIDGVKIEYRMKRCETDKMRAQNLLLFRFTNTTDQERTLTWTTKIFRDNMCSNCDRLYDAEYSHALTLNPNEVVEGDGTSKENKSVYIFGDFVNKVPGMSSQRLTGFELVELTVR